MYIYAPHISWCQWRPEGIETPSSRVKDSCEQPCGCWQLNSDLLYDQQVSLDYYSSPQAELLREIKHLPCTICFLTQDRTERQDKCVFFYLPVFKVISYFPNIHNLITRVFTVCILIRKRSPSWLYHSSFLTSHTGVGQTTPDFRSCFTAGSLTVPEHSCGLVGFFFFFFS